MFLLEKKIMNVGLFICLLSIYLSLKTLFNYRKIIYLFIIQFSNNFSRGKFSKDKFFMEENYMNENFQGGRIFR